MSGRTRSSVALRFGRLLARGRMLACLGQEELAPMVAMHHTEISLLERGLRLPRLGTAIRIAAGLEIEPDGLLEGIRWVPGPEPPLPGRFVVVGEEALAAELAELRAAMVRGRRRDPG